MVSFHVSKAFCAAFTALSTSTLVASAHTAKCSPVAGSVELNVAPSEAGRHSPLIYKPYSFNKFSCIIYTSFIVFYCRQLIVVGSFIYDYSRFSAYVNKLLCNIYYILLFSNLFNNIFCILKHMPFIIIL